MFRYCIEQQQFPVPWVCVRHQPRAGAREGAERSWQRFLGVFSAQTLLSLTFGGTWWDPWQLPREDVVSGPKSLEISIISNSISGFLFSCCPAPPCPAQEGHLEKYWLSRWLCPALHRCGERKWPNYRSPNPWRITESSKLGESPEISESNH